jgi:hypothetical protein
MSDPSRHGWRTSLIVPAVDLAGRHAPVVTGVIATQGGLQVGLRIGEDSTTLILTDQAAAQLIVNLREALLAKLQEEG